MKINRELDHLMELKQKLLLKLKAALVLDRIDLVEELSGTSGYNRKRTFLI